MLGLALLVHVRGLTGSYAAGGAAAGAYAAAVGLGGPPLGRAVDRHGQTCVLLGAASVQAALLVAVGLLPASAPTALVVAAAAAIGLATPPLGACARALLPTLVDDAGVLRAVYALESSALELTFVAGPRGRARRRRGLVERRRGGRLAPGSCSPRPPPRPAAGLARAAAARADRAARRARSGPRAAGARRDPRGPAASSSARSRSA